LGANCYLDPHSALKDCKKLAELQSNPYATPQIHSSAVSADGFLFWISGFLAYTSAKHIWTGLHRLLVSAAQRVFLVALHLF
jgi:hypothetical protein